MEKISSKMPYLLLGVLFIFIAIVLIRDQRANSNGRYREILPAGEMQEKYGLYFENYQPPDLDPQNVPVSLRHLLPIALKWGIGDDIIRSDFESIALEEEKLELKQAVELYGREISVWLDSFGSDLMSDEAAAYMYMLLAYEEMHLYLDE